MDKQLLEKIFEKKMAIYKQQIEVITAIDNNISKEGNSVTFTELLADDSNLKTAVKKK